METVIKTVTGEASFVSEQEFLSVDDAHEDRNPLTEAKVTTSDYSINNTKYKLKNEKPKHDADSVTTNNNLTDSPLLK